MQISYESNKLAKTVATARDIKKAYGTRAQKVVDRIAELTAAATLEVMRAIPAANCHELVGPLKGLLALDISGNHRIIFRPLPQPPPVKLDGGLDWSAVSAISVIGIGEDYH